jgi:hypothetical protein
MDKPFILKYRVDDSFRNVFASASSVNLNEDYSFCVECSTSVRPISAVELECCLNLGCATRENLISVIITQNDEKVLLQAVNSMPEDISLRGLTLPVECKKQNAAIEVPALQCLINSILLTETVDCVPMAYIIKEFVKRGYDVNEYRYSEYHPFSVAMIAVQAILKANVRQNAKNDVIFRDLLASPDTNWNLKSGPLNSPTNPLVWALSARNSVICSLHFIDGNRLDDPIDCSLSRFVEVAVELCKAGTNLLDYPITYTIKTFPCLAYKHPSLIKNLLWAGASMDGLVPVLKEKLQSIASDSATTKLNEETVKDLISWCEDELLSSPSLFFLCS